MSPLNFSHNLFEVTCKQKSPCLDSLCLRLFWGVRHQNQEHIYYPPDWAAKLDVCTVYDILKRLDQVAALYWKLSGRPDSCYYWVRIGLLTIGRPHHSMTVPTISGSPNTCTKASRPCVTLISVQLQNVFLYFSWPGFCLVFTGRSSHQISSCHLLGIWRWLFDQLW